MKKIKPLLPLTPSGPILPRSSKEQLKIDRKLKNISIDEPINISIHIKTVIDHLVNVLLTASVAASNGAAATASPITIAISSEVKDLVIKIIKTVFPIVWEKLEQVIVAYIEEAIQRWMTKKSS